MQQHQLNDTMGRLVPPKRAHSEHNTTHFPQRPQGSIFESQAAP